MSKRNKNKKHHLRTIIILMVLVVLGVGSYIYYQYAWSLRDKEEPTTHKLTTINERYSLTRIIDTLSVFPDVKEMAFQSYAHEETYGTYIIPGLEATKTLNDQGEVEMCTSMTPQGVAVIENYILVSAYCHTHTHNTVIYVINKTTHQYIKEIILPGKPHGGSIAYDYVNQNIWICSRGNNEAQVVSFTLADLEAYHYDVNQEAIQYRRKEPIETISANSFMTYYKGYLYMGYFSNTSLGASEKFKIMEDGSIEKDTSKHAEDNHPIAKFSAVADIPSGVQGITFHDDKLLLSISDGPYVPSKLKVYHNGEGVRKFSDKNLYKEILMPERMEQIYIDGNDVYVLFESASNAYHALSVTPSDRILKMDLAKILE